LAWKYPLRVLRSLEVLVWFVRRSCRAEVTEAGAWDRLWEAEETEVRSPRTLERPESSEDPDPPWSSSWRIRVPRF
jgi:hypothetical protein